jgi:16S rRNA (cytosine967-C5)-methyltransferase
MHITQQAAAAVLQQVLSGRNLNQVLSEALRKEAAFTPQQRGALQDLSYGTLRHYGLLDAVLRALLNKPLQDEGVRCLLLVTLYQLQFTQATAHTVVDQAVNAARETYPAASGLVNAILRNFLRRGEELVTSAQRSEVAHYSYPKWWIDKLRGQYGAATETILQAGNSHPPMTLRVNRQLTTPVDYLALLATQGMAARLIAPEAILLDRPVAVDKLPHFWDGWVSVQDAGAQQAAHLLDVQNGMRVLDACAAPGGKAAHLLESARIELVALDKDAHRLERVQENMQRLQLNAELKVGDAADPDDWWDGKLFDRILADVPCSASGVVRRHPDIKWLRRPSDIESFATQQEEILYALWPLLAAGGKLLYATCSVFARENQQVVDTFLSHHADATQLPISLANAQAGQLAPNAQHDGFFYALLHKHH